MCYSFAKWQQLFVKTKISLHIYSADMISTVYTILGNMCKLYIMLFHTHLKYFNTFFSTSQSGDAQLAIIFQQQLQK